VSKVAVLVESAFKAQRVFVDIASKASKPSDSELMNLLKPTSEKINEIQVDYFFLFHTCS
jgi:hypothetical protein